MKKLLIPLVAGVAILISQVVTGVSAQTPGYLNYEVSIPYAAYTEPPVESATPATDGCWDCAGSTMTEAEVLAAVCSPASLEKNPQMLNECFPNTWEWNCGPDGICKMIRIDLSPSPEPTPEPTPTAVPTPEATETVVAP